MPRFHPVAHLSAFTALTVQPTLFSGLAAAIRENWSANSAGSGLSPPGAPSRALDGRETGDCVQAEYRTSGQRWLVLGRSDGSARGKSSMAQEGSHEVRATLISCHEKRDRHAHRGTRLVVAGAGCRTGPKCLELACTID